MSTDEDFLKFGDVSRKLLGMQCQYGCHYLTDTILAKDIRWTGDISNYHGIKIHKDDVETFVARVLAWRKAQGIIA